jgi:hypothetical protein
LNPDSVLKTRLAIAKTEATILKWYHFWLHRFYKTWELGIGNWELGIGNW